MKTESFRGRDFITLLEWSKEEVETILGIFEQAGKAVEII